MHMMEQSGEVYKVEESSIDSDEPYPNRKEIFINLKAYKSKRSNPLGGVFQK